MDGGGWGEWRRERRIRRMLRRMSSSSPEEETTNFTMWINLTTSRAIAKTSAPEENAMGNAAAATSIAAIAAITTA